MTKAFEALVRADEREQDIQRLSALVRAQQITIDKLEQALAAPVQDSTCSETLRAQGKAYPRTCRKCGLGPCIGAPKQSPAAQRQWVDLKDEEMREFDVDPVEAKLMIAKLKEKNT